MSDEARRAMLWSVGGRGGEGAEDDGGGGGGGGGGRVETERGSNDPVSVPFVALPSFSLR